MRFLVFVLVVMALCTVGAKGKAASLTATPNPVQVGGTFHVDGCGLPRDREIIVRVGGNDGSTIFWNEFTVASDEQGCVSFDTNVGPFAGSYGVVLVVQQNANRFRDVGYIRVEAVP
jgi:hypothetical protein